MYEVKRFYCSPLCFSAELTFSFCTFFCLQLCKKSIFHHHFLSISPPPPLLLIHKNKLAVLLFPSFIQSNPFTLHCHFCFVFAKIMIIINAYKFRKSCCAKCVPVYLSRFEIMNVKNTTRWKINE